MSVTNILLLALFQGFQTGILCQKWEFPTEIEALNGSCVEIPCTYSPAKESETSSTVWYLYDSLHYIEIFNSKTYSSVRNDYKGRSSLVPGGSCSLRIDPVRGADRDRYYPGIAERSSQNAYEQQNRIVILNVTDTPGKPSIIGVGTVIEGNATIIQCHTEHTCATSPPSLEWNKPGQTKKQSLPLVGGYWREVSKLTYIPSYVDHGTPLRCRATYHNGLRSQLGATLNIIFPPRNVTVTLKRNRLREGSDVTLSCSSISNPAVQTYEWYQGNNKIKLRNRGPEITLRNLTRDIEPYSCTAVNEVGRGESALTEIPVLYAATEVRIIESQSEDGDIELTCYYLSSRPNVTHYSWMKDKSLLLSETGQTLLVNSSEQNYGSFSCIAHNSAGSSSSEELYISAVYQPVQTNYGTYIAIAGIICLLLISFIVFFSWRRKVLQTSPSPTGGEPQEPTYTDLVKKDVSEDYDTLKPVIPAEVTDRGGNVASIAIYENISIGTKQ